MGVECLPIEWTDNDIVGVEFEREVNAYTVAVGIIGLFGYLASKHGGVEQGHNHPVVPVGAKLGGDA